MPLSIYKYITVLLASVEAAKRLAVMDRMTNRMTNRMTDSMTDRMTDKMTDRMANRMTARENKFQTP